MKPGYLLHVIMLFSACAADHKPTPLYDDQPNLLTGYGLASIHDDFTFQGTLFPREDLSRERANVFFKAYEIELDESKVIYISRLAIHSHCDLENQLQLSLRIPGTSDIIALNPKAAQNDQAFMHVVPKGKYIFTVGVLDDKPCDQGFEVALSLSTKKPEHQNPVRPPISREQLREKKEKKKSLSKAHSNELAYEPNPLLGTWQMDYQSNGRNISTIRVFSESIYSKIVYENEILTEEVLFDIEYSDSSYQLTVKEVKTYNYTPKKFTVGDKYYCLYNLSDLDELKFACDPKTLPDSISESYRAFERKK